ncbi:MAG: type II toxin-antitoxin system RelE/ParE family toxin [Rhodothermales bacterium]|nr:type II toxin-antitoxin system RelE/ParE family toxin [Rhodothermales bacterium]
MASYSVGIKRSARKELEDVANRTDRRRIVARIRQLSDDPRPVGSQKLSGQELYRVRQGDYRIVYTVDDDSSKVVIVKIGHRKDVYR